MRERHLLPATRVETGLKLGFLADSGCVGCAPMLSSSSRCGRLERRRSKKIRPTSQEPTMPEGSCSEFTPRVIVFCCNWCAYAGADLAGVSRFQITPHYRVVRTMCSGRVDPELILQAFVGGVDGVMVAGCHPGDCHYMEGNYRAMRRVLFLRRLLEDMGVEPDRLALEWVSAGEGNRFREVVNSFVERVTALGPSPLRSSQQAGESGGAEAAEPSTAP
jgi:F420-non-reducing hydrogenase iron-sulfur subunit